MNNVVDLNSSVMSSASAISAIGLESTMTEEFQELKAFQVEVASQVNRVVEYYQRVKDIVIDELQNRSGQRLVELETFNEERHAAVEMLSSYYSKTAEAVRLNIQLISHAKNERSVEGIRPNCDSYSSLPDSRRKSKSIVARKHGKRSISKGLFAKGPERARRQEKAEEE